MEERNIGTREDANAIGVWGVIAGVIGARIYHVATDWQLFEGDWWRVFAIWQGGLGIPGGMLAGVLVGTWAGKRRGIPLGPGLNAVAPSLPLAQAIGRWGNYFNQELYGRPTTLPWALEIDAQHLPSNGQYPSGTTFHPTFLYESMWNLAAVRRAAVDRPQVQARQRAVAGDLRPRLRDRPAVGREPAHRRGPRPVGLRWNQWVAILLIVAAGGWLLFTMGAPRERVYAKRDVPPNTDHDETAALAMATAALPSRAEPTTSRSTRPTTRTRSRTTSRPTTTPSRSRRPTTAPTNPSARPTARGGRRSRCRRGAGARGAARARCGRPARLVLRPSARATIGCVVTTSAPGSVQ